MNLEKLNFDETPSINLEKRVRNPKVKQQKKPTTIWDRLFHRSKLNKPNKVAVLFLRNNGKAEPMELESKRGFFSIYGTTYNEDKDCVYLLGKDKFPLAIIPEWSLIPYGTKLWHDKSMLEKFHELQDHVLRGIRHAELVKMGGEKEGMKINPKAAIGLLIIGIVIFAVIRSYV